MLLSSRIFAVLIASAAAVRAFTFSFSAPSQCDNLQLSWTGGTAPFYLYVVPVYATARNVSIPASAFQNGKGSFQYQLPLLKGTQFLLSMSDATGFNTGGTSATLTVAASQGGSCNDAVLSPEFMYNTDDALTQCALYRFTNFTTAQQPITIYGMIPGGNVVPLVNQRGTEVDYTIALKSGTNIIWSMIDAAGRQGGTTDLYTVSKSQDASCLGATPPHATGSPPSVTRPPSSGSPSVSRKPSTTGTPAPSASAAPGDGGGSHTALIAGTVAGVGVALAVAASLGIFCWQQRRRRAAGWGPAKRHSTRSRAHSVDLLHGADRAHAPGASPREAFGPGRRASLAPASQASLGATASQTSLHRMGSPFADPLPAGHEPEPFPLGAVPTPTAGTFESARSRTSSGGTSAAARTKAAMAGVSPYAPQPRLFVHQDLEDTVPEETGDLIELPPQYSASRKPLQSYPSSASGSSSAGPVSPAYAGHSGDPFSPYPSHS